MDGYQFPFLLCGTDDINTDLYSWDDPYNSYDYWNLIHDIPRIAQKEKELDSDDADFENEASYNLDTLFSIVKDWGKSS